VRITLTIIGGAVTTQRGSETISSPLGITGEPPENHSQLSKKHRHNDLERVDRFRLGNWEEWCFTEEE
jgi:hypothetical protein